MRRAPLTIRKRHYCAGNWRTLPCRTGGDRMTALDDNWYTSDQLEDDTGQPVLASGEYKLPEASSRPSSTTGAWKVEVRLHAHLVSRQVSYRNQPWFPGQVGPVPDGQRTGEVIWPTWPASVDEEIATSCTPLADLQRHWDESISRMRDSAKWMAAVLGAALAGVVPTAPLAGRHHVSRASAVLGVGGLAFLAITMLLILRVMRPETVSYDEIQRAEAPSGYREKLYGLIQRPGGQKWIPGSPLYRWQRSVGQHPDLYLPCGVDSLTALRQSVTVEEMTLVALARARENATGGAIRKKLTDAQAARAARLYELRAAAAGIVAIGVYYKVRARSTIATYLGTALSALGIIAIVAAVTWPVS